MVTYRSIFTLKIADIWFSEDRDGDLEIKCDFAHYHDAKKVFIDTEPPFAETHYKTLVTYLRNSEEDIMKKFKSNVRNEIRRAIREGVTTKVYTSEMLIEDTNIIKEFDDQHILMCKQKNMKTKREYKKLLSYAKAGYLIITASFSNEKVCSYHVYITDKKVARLLHSVSVFRETSSNKERNEIGRANRMLHYKDILYFKSCAFNIYDWGGYSQKDELKSIADFKAGFGGEISDIHRYVFACSFISKLIVEIIKVFNLKNLKK